LLAQGHDIEKAVNAGVIVHLRQRTLKVCLRRANFIEMILASATLHQLQPAQNTQVMVVLDFLP